MSTAAAGNRKITMAGRLDGQVALVTGAGRSHGIGAGISARLTSEGAKVAMLDILPEVHETAKSLSENAKGYVCDCSKEEEFRQTVAKIVEDFGKITILVANMAVFQIIPAHEMTMEQFDKEINMNLRSYFLAFKYTLQDLKSAIFISSVHASFGLPGRPAYASSKAGVCGLTRQLAVEYGPKNIRVNAVLPGAIDTGHFGKIDQAGIDLTKNAAALKRLGKSEEIAAAVAFLASDDASFVTGHSLYVDGGWAAFKDSN